MNRKKIYLTGSGVDVDVDFGIGFGSNLTKCCRPAARQSWRRFCRVAHSVCGFCGKRASHERLVGGGGYRHCEIENLCKKMKFSSKFNKGILERSSSCTDRCCGGWGGATKGESTVPCRSSTFHNRRADNKQLEPCSLACWADNERHNNNGNNKQEAPLRCQFKMIMQTNINPLQVDACGCRLMALSDSRATLDSTSTSTCLAATATATGTETVGMCRTALA